MIYPVKHPYLIFFTRQAKIGKSEGVAGVEGYYWAKIWDGGCSFAPTMSVHNKEGSRDKDQ